MGVRGLPVEDDARDGCVTWYLEMHVDEHAHEVVGARTTHCHASRDRVVHCDSRVPEGVGGGDELAARESEKVAHRAYGFICGGVLSLREARPARMQLRIHLLEVLELAVRPKELDEVTATHVLLPLPCVTARARWG